MEPIKTTHMTHKNKTTYETPATEVVTVRIERTILSGTQGVQSMRNSYVTASSEDYEQEWD
jgi:hypothetical protein